MTDSQSELEQEVIKHLRDENREFYGSERGRGALRDIQQTFPSSSVYIAELLQNAVDEGATEIELKSLPDEELLVEHNGRPFEEKNVRGLCLRGVSDKGAATVGFMGIGFKAVFRSFQRVGVSSSKWRFSLRVPLVVGTMYGDLQRDWIGAVLPEWDPSLDPPGAGMKCRFLLTQRVPDLPSLDQDVQRVLGSDYGLLPLLARRGVTHFVWNAHKWTLDQREEHHRERKTRQLIVTATEENGIQRRWAFVVSSYTPSNLAVKRFLEHRQIRPAAEDQERVYSQARRDRTVELFVPLDETGRPKPPERGIAYALLPTNGSLSVGAHIQADWLLDVTRLNFVSENPWHSEIVDHIPELLAGYLEWLVDLQKQTAATCPSGYDVLPDPALGENEPSIQSDPLWSDAFIHKLSDLLSEIPFLPILRGVPSRLDFVSPGNAHILPPAIEKRFSERGLPTEPLFGSSVVETSALSPRAIRCLQRIGFLSEIAPDALQKLWGFEGVGRWRASLPEASRNSAFMALIEGLVELDERPEWKDAHLHCLPTEGGTWLAREAVTCYPNDWSLLSSEDRLQGELVRAVGHPDKLLEWQTQFAILQSRTAVRFLEPSGKLTLEDLAGQWWRTTPEFPGSDTIGLVISFTAWARKTASTRPGLVRKLLCGTEPEGTHLLNSDACLVADPFAASWRRRIFPSSPVVSGSYLDVDTETPKESWYSYFTSLDPPPLGRLVPVASSTSMGATAVQSMLPPGTALPERRVTGHGTIQWRGVPLPINSYNVIDWKLPGRASEFISQNQLSIEDLRAFSAWLQEIQDILKARSRKRLVYMPKGRYGWDDSYILAESATWVSQLRESAWVLDRSGQGPHFPHDVLPSIDETRPDAPVADLSPELVSNLGAAGVSFGDAIPLAPAAERLKALGPKVSAQELLVLLRDAVLEASNDGPKLAYLRRILESTPIFAQTDGRQFIDGRTRVTFDRVVRSAGPRGTLAGWCLPLSDASPSAPNQSLVEVLESIQTVPSTVTFEQVASFLSWVWTAEPPAEIVRRVLPTAYRYIAEDVAVNSDSAESWTRHREHAKVFVLGEQKWSSVATNPALFLNDLAEEVPKHVLSGLLLATPGHLGTSAAERSQTVQLIGLRLLSSKFQIKVRPYGPLPLPESWAVNLNRIREWTEAELGRQVSEDEELADDPETSVELSLPGLSLWARLEVTFREGEVERESKVVEAARDPSGILVSGTPIDFAGPLAELLVDEWKLNRHPKLAARLAVKLARLGDQTSLGGTSDSTPNPQNDTAEAPEEEPYAGPPDVESGVGQTPGTETAPRIRDGVAEQTPGDESVDPLSEPTESPGTPKTRPPSHTPSKYGSGGESDQHRLLKEFVAHHPEVLAPIVSGLTLIGTEHPFLSGDRVDILFLAAGNVPVAVEVEPDWGDLDIGAWQAAKYRHLAAMEWKFPSCTSAIGILVAPRISTQQRKRFEQLGVESIEVPVPV